MKKSKRKTGTTGGEADKVGNRYENSWTINCLLTVLTEEAEFIHLEPSGPEGDGAEFLLVKTDSVEHHQVKLGLNWTLRDLERRGVFLHLAEKLREPKARFVFVSDDRAKALDSLATKAKAQPEIQVYLQQALSNDLQG